MMQPNYNSTSYSEENSFDIAPENVEWVSQLLQIPTSVIIKRETISSPQDHTAPETKQKTKKIISESLSNESNNKKKVVVEEDKNTLLDEKNIKDIE